MNPAVAWQVPAAEPAFGLQSARVCFVGAGPGSADLITVRGLKRLAAADVVLADALVDPELRSAAPTAQWIDVGKRGFRDSTPQAEINRLLVALAQDHARVVRLKGGDPSVFGRLEEELAALAEAGITAEVVPGITAACAAAAEAQQPLTRRGRGRAVTLATAASADGSLMAGPERAPAPDASTEVLYMAGRQLPALAALLSARWPGHTPVTVVSRAGHTDALVTHHTVATLATARWGHATRPTVVTVGVGAEPVEGRAPSAPAVPAGEAVAPSPQRGVAASLAA